MFSFYENLKILKHKRNFAAAQNKTDQLDADPFSEFRSDHFGRQPGAPAPDFPFSPPPADDGPTCFFLACMCAVFNTFYVLAYSFCVVHAGRNLMAALVLA